DHGPRRRNRCQLTDRCPCTTLHTGAAHIHGGNPAGHGSAPTATFPKRSVRRTCVALALSAIETEPLPSEVAFAVASTPPPASTSSILTAWLRIGTGWFDIVKKSISRQPFGAF